MGSIPTLTNTNKQWYLLWMNNFPTNEKLKTQRWQPSLRYCDWITICLPFSPAVSARQHVVANSSIQTHERTYAHVYKRILSWKYPCLCKIMEEGQGSPFAAPPVAGTGLRVSMSSGSPPTMWCPTHQV